MEVMRGSLMSGTDMAASLQGRLLMEKEERKGTRRGAPVGWGQQQMDLEAVGGLGEVAEWLVVDGGWSLPGLGDDATEAWRCGRPA